MLGFWGTPHQIRFLFGFPFLNTTLKMGTLYAPQKEARAVFRWFPFKPTQESVEYRSSPKTGTPILRVDEILHHLEVETNFLCCRGDSNRKVRKSERFLVAVRFLDDNFKPLVFHHACLAGELSQKPQSSFLGNADFLSFFLFLISLFLPTKVLVFHGFMATGAAVSGCLANPPHAARNLARPRGAEGLGGAGARGAEGGGLGLKAPVRFAGKVERR